MKDKRTFSFGEFKAQIRSGKFDDRFEDCLKNEKIFREKHEMSRKIIPGFQRDSQIVSLGSLRLRKYFFMQNRNEPKGKMQDVSSFDRH